MSKQRVFWGVGMAGLLLACTLAGCGGTGSANPQVVPTVMLDGGVSTAQTGQPGSVGGLAVSGVVVPAAQGEVVAASAGRVQLEDVQVGQAVQAGQILAHLDGSERLAAAVAAARFELLSAQQALTDLQDNAPQALAQAQLRLATAQEALDKAEQHRGWKEYRVGNQNQIDVARADLIVAEDALRQAEDTYGSQAAREDDSVNTAAALSALSAARQARDRAQANLNYLLSLPNKAAVAQADAELAVASAERDAAQSALTRLQNGPDPAALDLAQARIANAQAQVAAAEAALKDGEISAPFDGVVTVVHILNGAWAMPGQPLISLANLNPLRVETTDLSERDVPSLSVGQVVSVRIEALQAQASGRVVAIAPLSNTLGGDVVYTTTIELDDAPPALRPGMSVEVTFP